MNTRKPSLYETEELQQFGMELQEGLEQMIGFERELNRYSKSTLILFIVLNLKEEQFERARKILDQLEQIFEAPGMQNY